MLDCKVMVIPDVHGRTFWKRPVMKALSEQCRVVFLGDYLDPYQYENISFPKALSVFKEIIALKRAYPDLITLLLGNHDLGYLWPKINTCRLNRKYFAEVARLLSENLDLFQLTEVQSFNGSNFLFSHAGVSGKWVSLHSKELTGKDDADFSTFIAKLEEGWRNVFKDGTVLPMLAEIGSTRNGRDSVGSCVWADMLDTISEPHPLEPNLVQIFGHTQQMREPVNICNQYYNLDCRQVFYIDYCGNIRFYTTDAIIPQTSLTSVTNC